MLLPSGAGGSQPLAITGNKEGRIYLLNTSNLGKFDPADAQIRMTGKALRASAAKPRQTGNDVITGLDMGDLGADLFDQSGAFVTEDGGGGPGNGAV